jgi:Domain of unknown function (DUF4258)
MGESELEIIEKWLAQQAAQEILRVTQHAHYPDHRRGACCLLCGYTDSGRPLHLVCTTLQSPVILITVYEPKLPKWETPTQRGRKP